MVTQRLADIADHNHSGEGKITNHTGSTECTNDFGREN